MQDSDIWVIKRQWGGAFYGTDLECSCIGVEFIACNAWELSFKLVLVEDICSAHGEAPA